MLRLSWRTSSLSVSSLRTPCALKSAASAPNRTNPKSSCRCGCRNSGSCSCSCCVHSSQSCCYHTTTRPSQPNRTLVSIATRSFSSSTRRLISPTVPAMAGIKEYKLKDIASLSDVKPFAKVESEVEGVDGGKVLVIRFPGQVHALSPRCTHYGAPLKNGVVTPDGRLTCPWHGGMFVL